MSALTGLHYNPTPSAPTKPLTLTERLEQLSQRPTAVEALHLAEAASKAAENGDADAPAIFTAAMALHKSVTHRRNSGNRVDVRDLQNPDYRVDTPKLGTWQNAVTGQSVRVYAKGEAVAPQDRQGSFGRLIQGLLTNNWKGAEFEQSTLTTGNNPSAGYLTQEALSAEIIDKARNMSVLARLGARTVIIPEGADSLSIARVVGDPTLTNKAEGEAFSPTTVTFDRVQFTPHTIGCVVDLSQELAQDAANVAEIVENTLARALAVEIDRQMLSGSGSAEILGVMNRSGVQTITGVSSVDYGDIFDAIEDLETVNAMPGGWTTTPAIRTKLRKLLINSEANNYAPMPAEIAALAHLTSNQVDSGSLYIGDFTQVIIGLKQAPRIYVSDTAGDRFNKHTLGVKIVWRGDVAAEHANHLLKITE